MIFFLSWIQLELSSTFDNWMDVFTISAKYTTINIMTVCTVYLLIHSIINSLWKSGVIFSIFITLLSVVNYYVIVFRGTPLTFMELKDFNTDRKSYSNNDERSHRYSAVYLLTIQNHGSWDKNDRKVIVCMAGDHSPSFAKDIVDQEHRSLAHCC